MVAYALSLAGNIDAHYQALVIPVAISDYRRLTHKFDSWSGSENSIQ